MVSFGASSVFEPIFVSHLTKDGDGETRESAVDASSEEQYWEHRPAKGIHVVSRMVVHYKAPRPMGVDVYGNGVILTNGILLRRVSGTGGIDDGVDVLDIYTDNPIKTNTDWASYCFDADIKTWGVGGEIEHFVARWSFWKAGRPGIRLDAEKRQALQVVLNDDFTGLSQQQFVAWGYTTGDQT